MSDETPKDRKLALHEYPRDFTEEQTSKAISMVAAGTSAAAVARELNVTAPRARTLIKRLEVMNAATKLRETKLIPDALQGLQAMTATMQTLMLDMSKRLIALEVAHGRVTKILVQKRWKAERDKETIKSLRDEAKELRDLIRKRGIV